MKTSLIHHAAGEAARTYRRFSVGIICWLGLLGCADTQNLKNMSAREIQTTINTPLYEAGTVERAWEDAFWDERLSYRVRNRISDVLDAYQVGRITREAALRKIRAIRNSSPNAGDEPPLSISLIPFARFSESQIQIGFDFLSKTRCFSWNNVDLDREKI